jgi:subtilisin family serine protease
MRIATRSRSLAVPLALCSLLAALALVPTPPSAQAQGGRPLFVPGEVLVQFRREATPLQAGHALARVAGGVHERVETQAMRDDGAPGLAVVQTPLAVSDAVRRLRQDPAVAFAEPNWILHRESTANDTYYTNGSLWGTYGASTSPANAYGSGAASAWAAGYTGSSAVYVGILDEGVQTDHPDLAANVWTNPFDPVDGIDNDGNGYIDDIHGWDFYHNDNSVYDSGEDVHGTHVAGIIGAVGGNGAGVAGVNWKVRLISGKFLGPVGGATSDAVKGLDYFTDLKRRKGLNIVAVNNSWGGGDYSQAMHDAIIRAANQNILFIAAAGNGGADSIGDNNDVTPSYPSNYDSSVGTSTQGPAAYDNVISVAAIDKNGNRATFSNYGATRVDLGAPGVGIYSTVPKNSYSSLSGTSMAAPYVTGAVALFASAASSASALAIKTALLGATIPTPSLQGITRTGGRLNLGGGYMLPPVHDVAVTGLSAPASLQQRTSGTVSVTVSDSGSYRETLSVSVKDTPPSGGVGGTLTAAQSVTLSPGGSATLSFTWNTTNATVGTHTLTASAATVSGETNTADNSRSVTSSVTKRK